jgi:methylenetetrahydrofolate reductase (NADPH)
MTATTAGPAASADPVQRIAALVTGFSLEATLPPEADIAALREAAPRGTPVFLSAVPSKPLLSQVEPSISLRAAGVEPVPHLAARNFPSLDALDDLLARLSGEAGVTRVLAIAGDLDASAGPLHDALDVIKSGLLQRHGITSIGIAGYPEGHPRIPHELLLRALPEKLRAAEAGGLKVEIVTQFCFDAAPIADWVTRLRNDGHAQRVRIGLAGPTSFTALLRYAKRCGVKASARGAARNTGLFKHMFGGLSAPDDLVRALALDGPPGHLGDIALHFFSFGGIPATARWATAAAQGHIVLDDDDGFGVKEDSGA